LEDVSKDVSKDVSEDVSTKKRGNKLCCYKIPEFLVIIYYSEAVAGENKQSTWRYLIQKLLDLTLE